MPKLPDPHKLDIQIKKGHSRITECIGISPKNQHEKASKLQEILACMYHHHYPYCVPVAVRYLPALLLIVQGSFVLGIVSPPLGILPRQLFLFLLRRLRFQGKTRFFEGRMPPGFGSVDWWLAVVVVNAFDRLAETLGPPGTEG